MSLFLQMFGFYIFSAGIFYANRAGSARNRLCLRHFDICSILCSMQLLFNAVFQAPLFSCICNSRTPVYNRLLSS